jgi:hypothetical protein
MPLLDAEFELGEAAGKTVVAAAPRELMAGDVAVGTLADEKALVFAVLMDDDPPFFSKQLYPIMSM